VLTRSVGKGLERVLLSGLRGSLGPTRKGLPDVPTCTFRRLETVTLRARQVARSGFPTIPWRSCGGGSEHFYAHPRDAEIPPVSPLLAFRTAGTGAGRPSGDDR